MATPVVLLAFASSLMVLLAIGGFGISVLLDGSPDRTPLEKNAPAAGE